MCDFLCVVCDVRHVRSLISKNLERLGDDGLLKGGRRCGGGGVGVVVVAVEGAPAEPVHGRHSDWNGEEGVCVCVGVRLSSGVDS